MLLIFQKTVKKKINLFFMPPVREPCRIWRRGHPLTSGQLPSSIDQNQTSQHYCLKLPSGIRPANITVWNYLLKSQIPKIKRPKITFLQWRQMWFERIKPLALYFSVLVCVCNLMDFYFWVFLDDENFMGISSLFCVFDLEGREAWVFSSWDLGI